MVFDGFSVHSYDYHPRLPISHGSGCYPSFKIWVVLARPITKTQLGIKPHFAFFCCNQMFRFSL